MNEVLNKSEYCRVVFDLEFQERFTFGRDLLLRLRRELKRAASTTFMDKDLHHRIINMLDPDPADDPYSRRLYQKPSPPFVIHPLEAANIVRDAGDFFRLEVIFFGDCGQHISLFCSLMQCLGSIGFYRGEGRFELINLGAYDQSGELTRLPIPDPGQPVESVPLIPFLWWVEELTRLSAPLTLTFQTPARLLSNNKPLFNPAFTDIFPFILRRVTSMFHAWYGVDFVKDAQDLINSAADLDVLSSDLRWQDWRTLNGDSSEQNLGGIVGRMHLDRIGSDELITIITLGSLLNIGKSASYGSGKFTLDFSD